MRNQRPQQEENDEEEEEGISARPLLAKNNDNDKKKLRTKAEPETESVNGDDAIFGENDVAATRSAATSASITNSSNREDARRVLATRPVGVLQGDSSLHTDQVMVQKADIRRVIFPWNPWYRIFWGVTALCSILTIWLEPFQLAFQAKPGTFQTNSMAEWVELAFNLLFVLDIFLNFHLAKYKNEVILLEKSSISREYMSKIFWVDLVGVFPFETLSLYLLGILGDETGNALLLSLLRLLRFVRLHRMKKLSDLLQYDARLSLLSFTLLRNAAVAFAVVHVQACAFYFIGRLHGFDDSTWLGPSVHDMTGFNRYITALYMSIVTFCTVGYGDFTPRNSTEFTVMSIFMLLNIVVAAWIIGSITLLVVKGDEKTGKYREALERLHQYGQMHQFDASLQAQLQQQLRLEFNNKEIADEQVLKHFPSAMRRKVLRKLYLQPLETTKLMKGIRPQFVDAFLASCSVEIFSPGETVVERGSILSDLFLLVGGIAEITTTATTCNTARAISKTTMGTSSRNLTLEAGDFIGDIGFFTESPQVDSVTCLTVCKTLTLTRSSYKLLAQDHPGSVGKILHNLLAKVRHMALELPLPKNINILRAGSAFDLECGYGSITHVSPEHLDLLQRQESLTKIEDLVQMHVNKQLDDQTTRLLFAASRGDTATISIMCDGSFDPDNADYDNRTALMVASMKGNTDVVRLLLRYKANPNLTDMHGSTALLEAVKNGHENTMDLLKKHGAKLCMAESLAASVLCQAVFDGELVLLKRLLKAGIDANAADYDKRTAAHIAAAEGNVAAIKVLANNGANLSLNDRWGNSIVHEAKRSKSRQLLRYLKNYDA